MHKRKACRILFAKPHNSFNYNYDENNEDNSYDLNSSYRGSSSLSKRNSIENDGGTTTEIRKEKNMAGKEELLDPKGNIIGRKKADGGSSNVRYNFSDMLDYKDDGYAESYYIYEGGNVYVKTVPEIEITYEMESEPEP